MQQNSWVPLFPEQASTFAWQVDALYFYLILVSVVFTVGIVAAILFFVVRWREKDRFATPDEIHGSMALETTWSVIPFIISMTIFLGGAVIYYNQYTPPANAMEVYVVGKQWMWKFQHGTGQREINELHIPVGRKVKLTMTTEDEILDYRHSDNSMMIDGYLMHGLHHDMEAMFSGHAFLLARFCACRN